MRDNETNHDGVEFFSVALESVVTVTPGCVGTIVLEIVVTMAPESVVTVALESVVTVAPESVVTDRGNPEQELYVK